MVCAFSVSPRDQPTCSMQAGVHASWQSMTRSGYSPGRFGCDHLVGRDRRPVIFTCIPGYGGQDRSGIAAGSQPFRCQSNLPNRLENLKPQRVNAPGPRGMYALPIMSDYYRGLIWSTNHEDRSPRTDNAAPRFGIEPDEAGFIRLASAFLSPMKSSRVNTKRSSLE